jgi:hypothetical protein
MARELRSALYADAQDMILLIDNFTGIENSEIEDLFPATFLAPIVDRLERGPEALRGLCDRERAANPPSRALGAGA